ncbi:MAG: hypothetical protein ACPLY9_01540 [Nitrososphaerales archaeon]
MTEIENLNKIYEEIVEYIKSQNLRIFPGRLTLTEGFLNQVIWGPESDDWKSFIEIAREEGAKTIIVEIAKGEDEHTNDIGSLKLVWIKDGVTYIFEEQAEWWIESIKEEREMEEVTPMAIRYGVREQIPEEVLKELQSKDESQLADEMLAFLSKEFPEANMIGYRNTELFWGQKGIHRWSLEPSLRLKIEKVEAIVRQKLEQERLKKEKEQIEKEKELIPKLVEECLEWAKKNQMKKVTKSNIDYFLIEKEIKLTRTSRDALYNQVNFKLQR